MDTNTFKTAGHLAHTIPTIDIVGASPVSTRPLKSRSKDYDQKPKSTHLVGHKKDMRFPKTEPRP